MVRCIKVIQEYTIGIFEREVNKVNNEITKLYGIKYNTIVLQDNRIVYIAYIDYE